MKSALVSVVIPTYNRARLACAAAASALAQDGAELEVLVVDDGSTDGTREAIAEKFRGEPRVRWIGKANGGVASARNLGLREARGEFIALLDADDAWLPGKLSLQLACLERFPAAGMVWTDMSAVDAAGRVLHERYLRRMYSNYENYPSARDLFAKGLAEARFGAVSAYCGDIYSPMVLGNLVHTSTVLLRRERAAKVGFFDEAFKTGEDYPFHLKTCREGPVAFADAATVRYAVGLPDALTSPAKSLELALNFLATLERSLAEDAARIDLPEDRIKEALAEAYEWAGQSSLDAGMNREARAFFLKSLKADPRRLRGLSGAAKSLLPASLRRKLASVKKRLRP